MVKNNHAHVKTPGIFNKFPENKLHICRMYGLAVMLVVSRPQTTPIDSYSSIDAGKVRKLYFNKFSLSPLLPCNTLHKYLKISTPVGLTPKSDWDKKLQFRLLFT